MRNRIHKHTISFKHAFEGIVWALRTQPNYQVHAVLSVIAVGAGFWYQITRIEFLIIIVMIFIGFAIETINTAIERTADAVDTAWREDIKQAKDSAAGAMLLFAIGACIVSAIIFVPYLTS